MTKRYPGKVTKAAGKRSPGPRRKKVHTARKLSECESVRKHAALAVKELVEKNNERYDNCKTRIRKATSALNKAPADPRLQNNLAAALRQMSRYEYADTVLDRAWFAVRRIRCK